jgi:hypothetical protein
VIASMTERQHRRTEEGVRDLGARVLDKYHQGKLAR